jgi:putative endonuclease
MKSDDRRRGHFIYIVRCADDTLYTGYARDPERRARVHNAGRGASYTAGRRPVSLVYSEACGSVGDALTREHQVKRLSRAMKERLIAQDPDRSGAASDPRGPYQRGSDRRRGP